MDVGGTFTDLVALGEGGVVTAKVPSTPRDQSVGVMNTVAASEVEAGAVTALAHGMTVTTNALLECQGARTALAAGGAGPEHVIKWNLLVVEGFSAFQRAWVATPNPPAITMAYVAGIVSRPAQEAESS